MKNMDNLDLDVINLLKDFPIDEENAVLYIRGNATEELKMNTMLQSKGNFETINAILFGTIMQNENFRALFYNVVLAALHHNQDEVEAFKISLKEMEKMPCIPVNE